MGMTPLSAFGEGHTACVKSLLQAGASIHVPDTDGVFPIHTAAAKNIPAAVQALLDYGCDPNLVSRNTNL